MAYPPKTPAGKSVIFTPTTNPTEHPEQPQQTGDQIVDESSEPRYPDGADLADETKVRLGDYLSALTLGHGPSNKGNSYPVQGGHRQITMEDAGRPTKIITGGQNREEQPTFAAGNSRMTTMPQEVTVTLEGYSNSGKFNSAEPASKKLRDIVEKNENRSGSKIFADIKPNAPNTSGLSVQKLPPNAPVIQQKIEGILATNRFSGTERTPYIKDGVFTQTGIPDQGKFGVYDPSDAQANAPWGGLASLESLQLVGHSLLMKATGHDDDPVRDPESGMSYSAALLPSFVQLIVKKANASDLRAKTAWGAPNVKTLTQSDLRMEGQDSFGALNNPHEPFAEGMIPLGMVALCITGMGTLVLSTALISSLVGLARGAPSIPPTEIPQGAAEAAVRGGIPVEAVGRSRGNPPTSTGTGSLAKLFARLGFPMDIMDKLDRAMALGIRAFYGLGMSADANLSGIMDGMSIDTAFNLVEAAGYYAGIIRHAVRDLHAYTEKVKKVGEKMAQNPIAGVEAALAIIADFFQLNSFKFLMTMAKIGGVRLEAHEKTFSPVRLPINDIVESPTSRIFKSRATSGKDGRLVWRHGALPSRYLLPNSFRTALTQTPLGSSAGNAARFNPTNPEFQNKVVNLSGDGTAKDDMQKPEAAKINSLSGMRIDPKLVQIIEDELEMEYMPFYFHDIRTNEIIAFNAFIETIKDSFKPDYTKTDGYGRMDSVMIYKKTTRTISVDFHLVATSFNDFNVMWWDINKLTTLIYPQWSRGTPVTSGDDNFIMPFSQIPTASPMVRLRIGDVVKSNYSKLALARLFGAGITSKLDGVYNIGSQGTEDKWKFEEKTYNSLPEAEQAKSLRNIELEKNFQKTPFEKDDPVGPQVGQTYFVIAGETIHVHPADQSAKKRASSMEGTLTFDAPADMKVKIKQPYIAMFRSGPRSKYECTFETAGSIPEGWGADAIIHLAQEQLSVAPPTAGEVTPVKGLKPSSMEEFYGPNNSIIRSFEQGMGRGLAGFIDGFDIDWDEKPWEVALGSRAPQSVKISINFAPIHDIPPGIDHDGFNRAPIYNVGDLIKPVAQDPYGQVISSKLNPDSNVVKSYMKSRLAISQGAGSADYPMGKGKTDAP